LRDPLSFPTRRSSDLRLHAIVRLAPLRYTVQEREDVGEHQVRTHESFRVCEPWKDLKLRACNLGCRRLRPGENEVPVTSVKKARSEEHTSELQSLAYL